MLGLKGFDTIIKKITLGLNHVLEFPYLRTT